MAIDEEQPTYSSTVYVHNCSSDNQTIRIFYELSKTNDMKSEYLNCKKNVSL